MTGTIGRLGGKFVLGFLSGILATLLLATLYFSILRPNQATDDQVQTNSDARGVLEQDPRVASLESSDSSLPDLAELLIQLRSQSRFARTLYLHRLLANTNSVENVASLFDNTWELPEMGLQREVQQVALRRLALLDPDSALTRSERAQDSYRSELVEIVFQEWSSMSLDDAVAQATALEPSAKQDAFRGILSSQHDLSPSVLREIAAKLDSEQLANDSIASSLLGKPIDEPAAAWGNFMVDFGSDFDVLSDVQRQLLHLIAEEWFHKSGKESIQAIASSLDEQTKVNFVIGRLLETIAQNHPERAFELASEISHVNNVEMAIRVVEKWAETDAISALRAVAAVQDHDLRTQASQAAIVVWGAVDPESLLLALDNLPEELYLFAQETALTSISKLAPKTAAERLKEVDDTTARKRIAMKIASIWSHEDTQAAFSWASTDSSVSEFQDDLKSRILWNAAGHDSRLAMELALTQPIAEDEIGLESVVIQSIAYLDADKALTMLQAARNQATREDAYSAVGVRLVRAGKSEEAIELVREMPISKQRDYFNSIRLDWAWNEPQDLFDKLDRMPSSEIKSAVALTLTMANDFHQTVTPMQREKLKTILDEMWWQALDAW